MKAYPIANLVVMLFISACQSDRTTTIYSWPGIEQIEVVWRIDNDVAEGDDRRTCRFVLYNRGSIAMDTGWKLYFHQFSTSFYMPVEADNRYDIDHVLGDLLVVSSLDSMPPLPGGDSLVLTYRAPYGLIKRSHLPHGLFFVLPDQSSHPVTNYAIVPLPADWSMTKGKEIVSAHPSAADRYAALAGIAPVATDRLPLALPAPAQTLRSAGTLRLSSGVHLTAQAGLENELEYLTGVLNSMLTGVRQGNGHQDGNQISLAIDSDLQGPAGAYRLLVHGGGVDLRGSDASGVFHGIQTLLQLIPAHNWGTQVTGFDLPFVEIVDQPGLTYRGLHLDVARNFFDEKMVKKVLDLMAFYKLNRLHLHLTDDEGWRLEIPGLPELTEVGALRGYSSDERHMLPPAYGSGPVAPGSRGSGYYSRDAFIRLLRYAQARHIAIIPEINGPGHAGAAIRAMEARYTRLTAAGMASDARAYRLIDPNDASRYVSAQSYRDNVLCVCLESVYTFLEKVIGEVVAMYQDAGADLLLIHTGGDEVPAGAWLRSPECERFLENEADMTSVDDLHPYFVRRYLDIAQRHGLRVGGWEEISIESAQGPDGRTSHLPLPAAAAGGYITYSWNAAVGSGHEDLAYRLANAGVPVVMCNVSNLYLDLAYNYDPEEPGLFWGGFVDTRKVFELTPYNILLSIYEDANGQPLDGHALSRQAARLQPDARHNLWGIQGQLWTETVKNEDMLEYYLLPKMLALSERAWNPDPAWSQASSRAAVKTSIDREWNIFANKVGHTELPRLDRIFGGFAYRLTPPGAVIERGQLLVRSEYPGLPVHYTLDGSDPTAASPRWTQPVPVPNGADVRVALFDSRGSSSRVVMVP